ADDGGVRRMVAGIGADRDEASPIKLEPESARLDDLATAAAKRLDEAGDEAERALGMAVLAHEEAADIFARQGRLELAQLVGVELVDDYPIIPSQGPGKPVL